MWFHSSEKHNQHKQQCHAQIHHQPGTHWLWLESQVDSRDTRQAEIGYRFLTMYLKWGRILCFCALFLQKCAFICFAKYSAQICGISCAFCSLKCFANFEGKNAEQFALSTEYSHLARHLCPLYNNSLISTFIYEILVPETKI